MRVGRSFYKKGFLNTLTTKSTLDSSFAMIVYNVLSDPASGGPADSGWKKSRGSDDYTESKSLTHWFSKIEQPDRIVAYRDQILRVVSYYWHGETATVSLLVLDRARGHEFVVPDLQQAVLSLAVHAVAMGDVDALVAYRQRHKSEIRGGCLLRVGCWEERYAFVVADSQDEWKVKLYGYLAGGTPHQPPHTYPLVFKHMPLQLADALYAMALWLTQSSFDPAHLIVHPRLTVETELIELRRSRETGITAAYTKFAAMYNGTWPTLATAMVPDSMD